MKVAEKFDGVFLLDDSIATVNLVPGKTVYGEQLLKFKGVEYRVWDFWRSKPAAAIKKNLKVFPLKSGMKVLYLGVASGTTSSHFSDIVGREGIIYGVDIAERVLRELMLHAERRGNILPILGDARKPEDYEAQVFEKVDIVYADVADPDQVKILIRNADKFLRSEGFAMIAIKSQSIDVIKEPRKIYEESLREFEKHFEILGKVELDPFEKGHMFVVMKKK